MINHKSKQVLAAQCGYAMLGIIAAIGVATTAVVVTSLSATAVRNDQARKDSNAMAIAKQALIAFAASHPTRPGTLPCPDIADAAGVFDGQSDFTEGGACKTFVGRLPTQTLGLSDLRDGAGERLWYVLSTNFADATANTSRINSNSYGTLIARDGEHMTYGVVAIIIAPGKPVGSQSRAAPNVNNWESYLESYTISTSTAIKLPADSTHNDLLSVITPADIFALVERRVVKELQNSLKKYSDYYKASDPANLPIGKLPWPAQSYNVVNSVVNFPAMTAPSPLPTPATTLLGYIPTDDPVLTPLLPGWVDSAHLGWFNDNNWRTTLNYRVDSDCASGGPSCGSAFATYTVSDGGAVSLGFSGGTANSGTKAVVSFSGVNTMYTNYKSTVLNAALQLQ